MTNPRMTERNHLWKRRVTAFGLTLFIALSALIGKQAEQTPVAAASTDTTGSATLTASTATTTATTIVPSASSSAAGGATSTTSSSSLPAVHTRTTSSK